MKTIYEFEFNRVKYRIEEVSTYDGRFSRDLYHETHDNFGHKYWERSDEDILVLTYTFALSHMTKLGEKNEV